MAQLRREVKDIMTKRMVTLKKEMSVKEAAELFAQKKIGGAPVVDEEGSLIGIVSESDLIMRDVRLHFPTFIQLLDGYIYLPHSLEKFESEFKRAVGAKVGDVMTTDVTAVDENATVEDVATLMIEKDIDRVPVIAGGKLVGIVSKSDLVKAISRS